MTSLGCFALHLMQVSWKGVAHPSYADWIGLLVPAGSDPTKNAPAKFQMASADADHTHLKRGTGRIRWAVLVSEWGVWGVGCV